VREPLARRLHRGAVVFGVLSLLLLPSGESRAAAPAATPEGIGHLQIKSVPGVNLVLDGRDRGTTEGDDGFVFRDLAAGPHRVEAWLTGFEKQSSLVLVSAGVVTVHHLRPFSPLPAKKPSPTAASLPDATGALIVQTLPVKATVDSSRLGWRKIQKGEEPFIATAVPKGQHKITFCNSVKCIDYLASIKTNDVVSLLVDFEPGQVHDVTREHKAQWALWRDACASHGDAESCLKLCAIESALAPRTRSAACAALTQSAPRVASAGRPASDAALIDVARTATISGTNPEAPPSVPR
jgi:hypothetical protein